MKIEEILSDNYSLITDYRCYLYNLKLQNWQILLSIARNASSKVNTRKNVLLKFEYFFHEYYLKRMSQTGGKFQSKLKKGPKSTDTNVSETFGWFEITATADKVSFRINLLVKMFSFELLMAYILITSLLYKR